MILPKIDRKGRMVIPADIREELGIEVGDEFEIDTEWAGERQIMVVRKPEKGCTCCVHKEVDVDEW